MEEFCGWKHFVHGLADLLRHFKARFETVDKAVDTKEKLQSYGKIPLLYS